jgi:regulator of sigma E protease
MLIFQLILSLSLLIILHELGHFIPAKLFKTRVEKFYLFFDPYFSLVKKKIGETTYGIGWLPLGGYVKISGMVDESMDKEQMDRPAEPWEFRSKPAWQRLIIMIGGVVVNIIVGCLIYSAILFTWGRDTLSVQNATYGLHCNPIMYNYGFQEGDKIVAIDGHMPSGQEKVNKTILLDDPKTITILRNNSLVDL